MWHAHGKFSDFVDFVTSQVEADTKSHPSVEGSGGKHRVLWVCRSRSWASCFLSASFNVHRFSWFFFLWFHTFENCLLWDKFLIFSYRFPPYISFLQLLSEGTGIWSKLATEEAENLWKDCAILSSFRNHFVAPWTVGQFMSTSRKKIFSKEKCILCIFST